MYVVDHSNLPRFCVDGRERFAAANQPWSMAPFEIWVERLEPGAEAAILPVDSIRIVVVLTGYGKLLTDGGPQRFHAPCSLVLPGGVDCQVVNVGTEWMQLVVTHGTQGAPLPAADGATN